MTKPKKKDTGKIIPYTRKPAKEKGLIEEGVIGDLQYKLFDRGNIQITDGVSVFRKDCDEFKKALSKKDYEKMSDEGSFEIPGAGDTDPLVIFKENGDVKIRLGGKMPPIILKLREILNKA
jgi:hypothetical protein